MTPLEMLAEWRRGCSCAAPEHPEECPECTSGLISAIERYHLLANSEMILPNSHPAANFCRAIDVDPKITTSVTVHIKAGDAIEVVTRQLVSKMAMDKLVTVIKNYKLIEENKNENNQTQSADYSAGI